MKRKIVFILSTFIAWVIFFALWKVVFMFYNQAENPFVAGDVADVLWHGLSMDMSTAGYLVALPLIIAWWGESHWAKRILIAYSLLVAFVVSLIVSADCFLYEFWKFKLNASIFSYMGNAEGAANSVSLWYILSRIGTIVLSSFLMGVVLVAITLRCLNFSSAGNRNRKWWLSALAFVLLAGVNFLVIRGSISTGVQNVGTSYYSQNLFLNHSAVNPAFSLLSSIKRTENYSEDYQYFSEEELAKMDIPQYPYEWKRAVGTTMEKEAKASGTPIHEKIIPVRSSATDTCSTNLLRTQRPNILIVMMESFGGKFVEELGGVPGVAPNLSRFIKEGVFFDNYYSNSFRTDRGTVSLFSGWVSYPTVSPMRLPDKLAQMPGLGKSLQREGYETSYLYAGDITIMGKSSYLISSGFKTLYSQNDFSLTEAKSSKWGVCDGISSARVLEMLTKKGMAVNDNGEMGNTPWLFGYQTLSSHEPFEVPYQRLADKTLNAFAYTDDCVGKLIDGLKKNPVWDNLLVVLVPDHGFLYDLTYEDPEFFHSPMLWLGGAIKEPQRIHTLMNQSDFCATLLAQMGISHEDYPYSRNVLGPSSPNFVYCSFPSGIMYGDESGITVFDITSNKVIADKDQNEADRTRRLKAAKGILQKSYKYLDTMK